MNSNKISVGTPAFISRPMFAATLISVCIAAACSSSSSTGSDGSDAGGSGSDAGNNSGSDSGNSAADSGNNGVLDSGTIGPVGTTACTGASDVDFAPCGGTVTCCASQNCTSDIFVDGGSACCQPAGTLASSAGMCCSGILEDGQCN